MYMIQFMMAESCLSESWCDVCWLTVRTLELNSTMSSTVLMLLETPQLYNNKSNFSAVKGSIALI